MAWLLRPLICIGAIGLMLYGAISHQNKITQLRMELPLIAKEVDVLHEKNRTLLYEVERFEDPSHLLQLSKQPEFGHLRYPHKNEVITIEREL